MELQCLVRHSAQVAAEVPDRCAVVAGVADPGERSEWTYADLLAEAERAARALRVRCEERLLQIDALFVRGLAGAGEEVADAEVLGAHGRSELVPAGHAVRGAHVGLVAPVLEALAVGGRLGSPSRAQPPVGGFMASFGVRELRRSSSSRTRLSVHEPI